MFTDVNQFLVVFDVNVSIFDSKLLQLLQQTELNTESFLNWFY